MLDKLARTQAKNIRTTKISFKIRANIIISAMFNLSRFERAMFCQKNNICLLYLAFVYGRSLF